jgi:coenzyme Q-binding protein COQ10
LRHSLTRASVFKPGQLFDLVADVERYPEFVPWVTGLRTRNRRQAEDGVVVLDADADVGFSLVHERFSTRVKLDRAALAIDVDLISGPFRRLANQWRFLPLEGGAQLSFQIDFEFQSRLLDRLLASNFHRAGDRLVRCFEARAGQLYG